MAGRRVAVLADGGGHGGIAAALLQRAGLELPPMSEPLRERLRSWLPPTAAVSNPIDLAGGGEQDIESFDRTTRALLGSGEVDALLLSGYFGGYSEYSDTMGRAEEAVVESLADAARSAGRPLVVQTMHPDTPASRLLRERGVPVFRTIERAAAVCGRLAESGERVAEGVPALPPAVAPLEGSGYEAARDLLAHAPAAQRHEDLGAPRGTPARLVAVGKTPTALQRAPHDPP